MRLTWRDAITTILAGLTGVIALAVTLDWGCPLLGDYRSGVGVLAVVGLAAGCGSGIPVRANVSTWSARDPFIWVGSLLGVSALGLIVSGLIVGTQAVFIALVVNLLALWVVATIRHALHRTAPTAAHHTWQRA